MEEQTLSQYLRNLRKSNNYSQEFVASYLDISRQAYSHYETGRVVPPFDNCCKLAELYNIPQSNILNLLLNVGNFASKTTNPQYQNDQDELSDFIQYTTDKSNEKKLKLLSRRQKELLYYFDSITADDQAEIIEIMKYKKRRLINH